MFGEGRGNARPVLPLLHAGGRLHFSESVALTLRVGYPDVRYFTTVFRQTTGATPAVYRTKITPGTKWVNPEHALNRP